MQTLDFYQTHANDFFAQTINVDMANIYQPFIDWLPNGQQHILDVGCGSGRDSVFFAKQGYQVTAIDGSENLIELAKQTEPNINWQCLMFEQIGQQNWRNQFTGIWACASLLHITYNELPKILQNLMLILQPNGVLYASFKYGEGERAKDGRFFCDINQRRWEIIEKQLLSCKTVKTWLTTDNRPDRQEQWFNVLIKKN